MIKISVVNQSTVFPDSQLASLAQALQIQVSRDFYPVWGVQAQIYWTPTGSHPTADHWIVALLDNADQAGALGYHDLTPTGKPLGKVFVKTTLDNGMNPTVTASHELLEILGDPDINLTAEFDDASGAPAIFYAYEVGDPCEDDSLGYVIDVPATVVGGPAQILVSDFVYPAWFESFRTTGPFDFRNKITAPFQLLPGGYIGLLDLSNLSAGWQQKMARFVGEKEKMAARPRPGSRRERRKLPRDQWLTSTYPPGTQPPIQAAAL